MVRVHGNLLSFSQQQQTFSFFFLIDLFILFYFWLRWVFAAVRGLSLVAVSGGYFLLQCAGFSLWWLLLLWSTGSRHVGFSSCGTRAQQLWLKDPRAQAQQLWHMGLVAPRHVGSSPTRAQTRVPCIGRQIVNHCATREDPTNIFFEIRKTDYFPAHPQHFIQEGQPL